MKKLHKKSAVKKALPFLGIFLILLIIESAYFVLKEELSHRLPLGISIANTEYSLAESNDVITELKTRTEEVLQQPLRFSIINPNTEEQEIVELNPAKIDLKISVDDAVAKASRELVSFSSLSLPSTLNEKRLEKLLLEAEPGLKFSTAPAQIFLNESGELEIKPEKSGMETDFSLIVKTILENASRLSSQLVEINPKTVQPSITTKMLEPFREQLKEIIREPLTLKESEYRRFEINLADRLNWFEFGTQYEIAGNKFYLFYPNRLEFLSGEPILFLNKVELEKFITKELNPLLAKIPHEVIISQTLDEKIEFDGIASHGRMINTEKLFEQIKSALRLNHLDSDSETESSSREILISFQKLSAPVKTTEKLTKLGITELIGEAVTGYAGSPNNRQHNIRTAAEKLNGLLICPDEEFSFVGMLGPVTSRTGYRNELVIKKGDVTPEIGGGVCQVSTTFFRTALKTGLPITEQKPHSLKVHYYDPPGLDATIYPGQADLKFINNTNHHILIQTHVEGTTLRVNFFGTSDGRSIELTGPLYPDNSPITSLSRAGLNMQWQRNIFQTNGEKINEVYYSAYRIPPKH